MPQLSELQEARLKEVERAVQELNQQMSGFISRAQISRLDMLLQTQIKDMSERVANMERIVATLLAQP